MKVHVIFAQRKESYPGEYGPEAMAVATEYEYDDNPDYLDGELSTRLACGEFESVRIVALEINGAKLMELLRPSAATLVATLSANR